MDSAQVGISNGPPDTVLPEVPVAWRSALDAALAEDPSGRFAALSAVAARYPAFIDVWAELSVAASDTTVAYAFARVGYHRGLDFLRASGWRGTGYVRFVHPSNRGFLKALAALRERAGAIGEHEEEERCALFLRQLDPGWPPRG